MNERIQELLKHAVIAVDNPFPGNPLNDELAKMYIPDCFAEKFAELIVKECAGVLKKDMELAHIQLIPLDFKMYANGRLQRTIKEHFGVEE